ncbi:hypothetical protein QOZ80_2BG0197600 [Eleusine coracana subsp. coracana]|nr:hypothetical protein QOZ80_2BG0197600 [Eleusine coracana subsp. coracana]
MNAANLVAAANYNERRRIPRVIRNAMDDAAAPVGYSPAVSVQITGAHCWARYDVVVPALRSISSQNLLEQPARAAARATLNGLFEQHPAPFDADVRFPEGIVYLSLELPPLGPCMRRLNTALHRLEATTGDGHFTWRDKNTTAACVKVMEAVANAAGVATSVWAEAEDAYNPVLYDRVVFEERFRLTWTDDDNA